MSDEPRQPANQKKAPLDGEWFQRERLRVAIGRRVIALRLNVPESRIHALEVKKREVPASWLPVLATLEFRVPSETAPSPRTSGQASPVLGRRDAVPSPPAHQPDAQTFVHRYEDDLGGFWLRVQRELRHILQKDLSRRLGVSASMLSRVEHQNNRLRREWLPILRELGFPMPPPGSTRPAEENRWRARAEARAKKEAQERRRMPNAEDPHRPLRGAEKLARIKAVIDARLTSGRRLRVAAVQVLVWVAEDLSRASDLDLTYKEVAAALQTLYRRRR
jgi:transcriptional regulator with XRE-family HTH domain